MLLLIFGAGASYDSVNPDNIQRPRFQERPPLAKELFEIRDIWGHAIDKHPECVPLIYRMREAVKKDIPVETELENIRAESDTDHRRPSQLAALRMYIRQIISDCEITWLSRAHGITNYVGLIDRIEKWRIKNNEKVRIVTFNYDTFIESACERNSVLKIRELSSYVANDDYKIFKVHGSVDWARKSIAPDGFFEATGAEGDLNTRAREQIIKLAESLKISEETVKIDSPKQYYKEEYLLFPSIAIPVEKKKEFECPEEHTKQLIKSFKEIDRVLVIGWRGTEKHFLDMWKVSTPFHHAIEVVSTTEESATKTIERISQGGVGIGHSKHFMKGGGFSKYLESEDLETFLKV